MEVVLEEKEMEMVQEERTKEEKRNNTNWIEGIQEEKCEDPNL